MLDMDKTPIVPPGALRDGFKGQRMFVLPRPVVRAAIDRPVTNRLLVTDAGFFPHAAKHGRTRPNGAPQHVFMVCTDGSGTVSLDGTRHQVEQGDAVLIRAGEPHEYLASEHDPWTLWWMHVSGADAGELFSAALSAAGGPITHLRETSRIASLISQVIDALDSTTAAGLTLASGAAWNALAQVAATGRRARGQAQDPVELAVEHLRATTPQRTSVEELAGMVGLSPSQFSALFRQKVGVPPVRYQSDLRMARAREMLDSTDMTVAAISAACGYDDPLYFSRRFTKTHGVSPSSYRQRTV